MSEMVIHLDTETLDDLKDIMESEFQTLINTFMADSERKLAELPNAQGSGDLEAVRGLAHSLKGSSSNVCAVHMSTIAQELEAAALNQQSAEIPALITALQQEYATVRDLLLASI